MSAEERKAMVRRIIDEAMGKGNLAIVDQIMPPNYIFHSADGTQPSGLVAFKQYLAMARGAFSDTRYNVEAIACDGDILAVRFTFVGTNTGSLRGMPPTGKKVAIQEAVFYRFEGDKPVEEWQFINQLALFQQLGVGSPAPQPSG